MSEGSDLDAGEAGDRRSDPPMNGSMELVIAATLIAAETAGATVVQPIERNENGQRTRRNEALATA